MRINMEIMGPLFWNDSIDAANDAAKIAFHVNQFGSRHLWAQTQTPLKLFGRKISYNLNVLLEISEHMTHQKRELYNGSARAGRIYDGAKCLEVQVRGEV